MPLLFLLLSLIASLKYRGSAQVLSKLKDIASPTRKYVIEESEPY